MIDTLEKGEPEVGPINPEKALEAAFADTDSERFKLEPWQEETIGLDTPLYRGKDGSSILAAIDLGDPHEEYEDGVAGGKRLLVLHSPNEGYFLIGQNESGEAEQMPLEPSETWKKVGRGYDRDNFT